MKNSNDFLDIYETDDSNIGITVPIQLIRTLLAGRHLYVIDRQEFELLESLKTALRAGVGR